ncbi:MAG: AgmX/PglI C-terminal domain-containing protein [Polyangiaceae bacterium]
MKGQANRTPRVLPVLTLFTATSALGLLVACGGKPAASPEGATGAADGKPAAAVDAPSAGGAAADPTKGTGPATTTTPASTLPDGGELQGAKLQSGSKTVIENKTEGTPKPQAGSSEPGRRREDIQTIVMSHRDEARKCYDDGVKGHPGVEGDLVIAWKIDPKGAVTEIAVDDAKSQIHEAGIGKCIIDIIKKIPFAESPKGFETRFSYPFNFKPRGPQGAQPAKKP